MNSMKCTTRCISLFRAKRSSWIKCFNVTHVIFVHLQCVISDIQNNDKGATSDCALSRTWNSSSRRPSLYEDDEASGGGHLVDARNDTSKRTNSTHDKRSAGAISSLAGRSRSKAAKSASTWARLGS
mmetsp:Transcript_9060/g.18210  ORF Transcript_9060/g.18210 Transcript_9060/m.18210 type:complete len:127 (+) Transcript_9060:703-1083(+)